jgi:hypothetical protein
MIQMLTSCWFIARLLFQPLPTSFKDNDPYPLYSQIVDTFIQKRDHPLVIVSDCTTTRLLQRVDLKEVHNRALDPSKNQPITVPAWTRFLQTASTEGLRNMKLVKQSFRSQTSVRLASQARSFYRSPYWRKGKYKRAYGTFFLSPVVFSSDTTKALCVVYIYQGPEAASETIIYFEKREGRWGVYHLQLLSIS